MREKVKDDGGPAFPGQRLGSDGLPECEAWNGMSLRDYFAGQALAGLMADPNTSDAPRNVAASCYRFADAMIAEKLEVKGE